MPRFTIDLSEETVARLDEIAKKNHITKAEAMRRAFSLLSIASAEKSKGHSLAIIKEDKNNKQRIVSKLIGVE